MISSTWDWQAYLSTERINPSTLVHGIKSMKSLRRQIRYGFGEPTDAMRFGTGLHAMLLEPDEFESRFCVMPDFHKDESNTTGKGERSDSKATKYYKEQVANFQRDNSGKCFITRAQYDNMLFAIESIRSRPKIVELIESSQKEVTVFGSIDGIECKGRLDLLSDCVIGDLKTTVDASPRAFGRTFSNLHYGFKLAMYRELVRQNAGDREVKIIVQETAGDYDTVLHSIDATILDTGLSRVRSVLADYKLAMQANEWHGVDRGADEVPLLVPQWELDKGEQSLDWSGVETVDSDEVLQPEGAYF